MYTEDRVTYSTIVRDFPRGERPRERLRGYGSGHLSNAELIAILLRTRVTGENVLSLATRILSRFQGLSGFSKTSFAELCDLNGISEAKACQILAALELGRRAASLQPEDRPVIRSPEDVANLMSAEMSTLEQEYLRVALLDSKYHVIGVREIYVGNVNSSVIRPAEVFRPAIRENAVAVVVVHNHPSGDPTPSPQDVSVTADLKATGELLGIELLDHIVIGNPSHFSLKERGLGF